MRILISLALFCVLLLTTKLANNLVNMGDRIVRSFNYENIDANEDVEKDNTPKQEGEKTDAHDEAKSESKPEVAEGKVYDKIDKSQLNDSMTISKSEYLVLQKLSERRQELDKRAAELEDKKNYLIAYNDKLDDKILKVQNLISKLEALLKDYDEAEKKKIENLVKIYETMKPKEAAAIFEQLDMDILLKVIYYMKQTKSALIIAQMNPAKAKDITIKLSEYKTIPASQNIPQN